MSGGITSCVLWNGADRCTLTAPRLTAKDNFAVDGWLEPDSGDTLASGASFTVTPDTSGRTYFAVTRSTLEYSVTFNLRDSAHFSMSSETLTCKPTAGSCSVTVPVVTPLDSAYSFLGWTLDASSTDVVSLGSTLTLTSENSGSVYYSVTKRLAPLTVSFEITDQVHFSSTSVSSVTCDLYNGATSCSVPLPGVSLSDGFVFDGWSRTSGSQTAELSAGTAVSFTSDTTLYSVSHESTPLSATFEIQNTTSSRFPDETTAPKTLECYKFNGASSCSVTAPSFYANSGYTVYGWDEDPSAETATYAIGSAISLSASGRTFYSIIANTFTITFISQDPDHLVFGNTGTGTATQVCDLRLSASCTVNFPGLALDTDLDFLGWTTENGGTSAMYQTSDSVEVTSATTYYTVSKKDVTLSFNLVDTAHLAFASGASNTASCTIYNSASSCSITAPSLNVSSAYTLLGWSTTSGSTVYSWNGSAQNFSASATYYSVSRASYPFRINYVVRSGDVGKITLASTYDECYVYNGAESCTLSLPSATATSDAYELMGWAPLSTEYDMFYPVGTMFNGVYSTTNLYAVVGELRDVSFSANTNSTAGSDSADMEGNNIAATALSFTSGKCITYHDDDCFIKNMPRIYSKGNDVIGFATTPLGDGSTRLFPAKTSYVSAGDTLYGRVWNIASAANGFSVSKTYNIKYNSDSASEGWVQVESDPGEGDEAYTIEFESNFTDEDVMEAYASFILEMNNHLPGFSDLHGKTRFLSSTSFDALYNPDLVDASHGGYVAGITYTWGQFAPVVIRVPVNSDGSVTEVSNDVKYALVHELGHAFQQLVIDRTGAWFANDFDNLRLECWNLRESGTPCLSDYAFSNVTYNSSTGAFEPTSGHTELDSDVYGQEFFAELFSAWYSETYGTIAETSITGNYGTKYDDTFAADAADFMDLFFRVIVLDYNFIAGSVEISQ